MRGFVQEFYLFSELRGRGGHLTYFLRLVRRRLKHADLSKVHGREKNDKRGDGGHGAPRRAWASRHGDRGDCCEHAKHCESDHVLVHAIYAIVDNKTSVQVLADLCHDNEHHNNDNNVGNEDVE